jgi:ornithine decarboxylase
MGVDPARIIYAQPCKTNSFIRYAAQQGVKQMTFDNAEELYKIKRHFPAAELFLRISTDDSSSLCRLSLKFGAALSETAELLALAKHLALDVVGVSFHVGSGATDPNLFVKAIHDARVVFDEAARAGFSLRTLDIGGGFSSETFERMAAAIGPALDACFPPHIRIIGEPGRYYVARAFQLACAVIARRTIVAGPDAGLDAGAATSYMLYLNDGVYGNFSSIMYDHQQPVPKILRCDSRFLYGREPLESSDSADGLTQYSIWGPTCDGIDCITPSCTLPAVLNVGDWLYFENMGGMRATPLLTTFFLTLTFS